MNKKDVKCGEDPLIHEIFSMVNAAFCFNSWEHKVDLEHPYKYDKFQQ
jgi:hypothetical protein